MPNLVATQLAIHDHYASKSIKNDAISLATEREYIINLIEFITSTNNDTLLCVMHNIMPNS